MTKPYNTTQLSPDTTMERHVYHRDQFAHYLRWTHVLKRLRINQRVLDWGCGSGNMLEVMYRNRYKGAAYAGLDVRPLTISKANEKYKDVSWAEFHTRDLCSEEGVHLPTSKLDPHGLSNWDIITCFEVIEHIGKARADQFLRNIVQHAGPETTILLSTPIYDEATGAADNHIVNGEMCEFEFNELKVILERYFTIEEKYGTFASQKDYKKLMNPEQRAFYDAVHPYFDSNILSNLMAPLFPEHSRNCLWVMKKIQ
mgnify:FL=1